MIRWLKELDRILRGDATRLQTLREGTIDVRARGLTIVILLLGMFYGLCMGTFAVVSGRAGTYRQMLASMAKVPALFLLTLLVTFPSLYVFNALVGSRLSFVSLVRLLVAAMAVMLALLASFGTIVAFFSFTTESYPFMVLLNVAVFAVAGFLGLSFLLQTLHRLTVVQEAIAFEQATPPPTMPPPPIEPMGALAEGEVSPLDPLHTQPPRRRHAGALDAIEGEEVGRHVKLVFRLWIIVFGLVGAQMSWVLRPFIGGSQRFVLFRPRGGNFFEAVVDQLGRVLGRHW